VRQPPAEALISAGLYRNPAGGLNLNGHSGHGSQEFPSIHGVHTSTLFGEFIKWRMI
jgi:hypothetical protein